MYKKKPTKSFFDSGNDNNAKSRNPYFYRNKENVAKTGAGTIVNPGRTTSDETIAKLSAFTYTDIPAGKPNDVVQTPSKDQTGFSSSQAEVGDIVGSQAEDRVRWKISPPPANKLDASNQKLTINEMFDIYQASQHSAETPVRHVDPTEDLWSRYDSAEPLPYLDLELSPGPNKTPRSDAKLRRTTSLPTWSADPRTRKRRKLALGPDRANGRMQSMMEQVQRALVKCDPIPVDRDPPESRIPDEVNQSEAQKTVSSDDFGGEDLDDAYLALPELCSPAPRRSTSNPLPLTGKSGLVQQRGGATSESRVESNHVTSVIGDGKTSVVQADKTAITVPIPSGNSSDYGADFDETDLMEASQVAFEKPEAIVHYKETKGCQRMESADDNNLTPAQLLEGLDDDVFSDFEEDVSYVPVAEVLN